jgi:photosystem II stability/assembly factor-like uncharacterized protein
MKEHTKKPINKNFFYRVSALLALAGFLALAGCEQDTPGGGGSTAGGTVPALDLSGVPNFEVAGDVLDLGLVKVEPPNANQTIEWEVTSPGTTGVPHGPVTGGKLTPKAAGTMTLRATVQNPGTAPPLVKNFNLKISPPILDPILQTWTKAPGVTAAMPGEIQTVCFGKGTFVAGSRENDGRIAWSPDGVTWTGLDNTTTTFGNNFVHVRFLNNEFWAVGGGGHMARSSDGKVWTAVESPGIALNIVDIAYGNSKFVAVGDQGCMSYSTDNGATWTTNNQTAAFGPVEPSTPNFKAIGFANGNFLAVGQLCRAVYSSDGVTWTDVSSKISALMTGDSTPPHQGTGWLGLSVVAYGAGLYVVASQGILLISSNLQNWEKVALEDVGFPRGHRWGWVNSLIYAQGRFILGGGDGGSAYSTNGRNWTPIKGTNPIFHNFHFINGLAWGNGRLVGVGATCSDPNCSNNPKSNKENDHNGNAGCVAYTPL